jgi:hypothetical protein
MNNKKMLLALGVIAVLILAVLFKLDNSSDKTTSSAGKVQTDLLSSALQMGPLNSEPIKKQMEPAPSNDCQKNWEELVQVPITAQLKKHGKLIEVSETTALQNFLSRPLTNCQVDANSPLFSAHNSLLNQCHPGTAAATQSSLSSECVLAYLAYRFKVIDLQSANENISEINNVSTLGAKLFARAFSDKVDLAAVQQISRRILELEPTNSQAMDYGLTATFADWEKSLREGDIRSANQLENEEEALLTRAQDTELSELKLAEIEMNMARLKGDPQSMIELSDSFLSQNEMEGFGRYYRAWAYHLLGQDKEMAQQLQGINKNDSFFDSANLALETMQANHEPLFFHNLGKFVFGVVQKTNN